MYTYNNITKKAPGAGMDMLWFTLYFHINIYNLVVSIQIKFYISNTMHQTQQLLNKTISAPKHSGLIAVFRVMIMGIVLRDQVWSIT